MKNLIRLILVGAICAAIAFFAFLGFTAYREQVFSINCTQYIKRAADAATVETAKEELEKAISYAEENHLTSGDTSLFWKEPANDIGFWFQNLKSSLSELENLPSDASLLEKSNALMRLREALTDQGENGISVTLPNGIALFPYNSLMFWVTAAWLLLAVALFVLWSKLDLKYN